MCAEWSGENFSLSKLLNIAARSKQKKDAALYLNFSRQTDSQIKLELG